MNSKSYWAIGAAALLAASVFSVEYGRAKGGVVASIKPLHSLVASVMEGVDEPELIVDGAGSPHNYVLKPSEAASLERAKVIFWIGEDLETFLVKPLKTLGGNAAVASLTDLPGLTKLATREGGYFESHDHDHESDQDHQAEYHEDEAAHEHDEDHDHESDHDHEHEDEHHADEATHEHDDDHDHESGHAEVDSHIWLAPANAKVLVKEIERVLSNSYPEHTAKFHANAHKVEEQLDSMVEEIKSKLEHVQGKNFLVFHDAYQYFEQAFDVYAAGTITVNPEVAPGAERLAEIRTKIDEVGVECIFSEPQFSAKIIDVISEGKGIRSAVLDPLGANLDNGPELYFNLIRNIATSMHECLEPHS